MDGFELAARFSLVTNRRNFCGPADAAPALYRAITEGTGREEVERMLSRFEALYPYLEAIAEKHGLRPFDRAVVEAYWIGNELLDAFGRRDFVRILDALVARGLPAFVARELAAALPEEPLPHHLFHVGFVGVGAVTGHVETTLPNMESCRPAAAEVTGVGRDRLDVRGPSLEVKDGALGFGAPRVRTVTYDPRVLPGVEVGDPVALHWDWPAVRLTPEMHRQLNVYSDRALTAICSARRAAAP